jgi:hypothetical protein
MAKAKMAKTCNGRRLAGSVRVSVCTFANTRPSAPVEIPLQDFAANGVDLTQLSLFKVAFEWEEMNGTVYLDDIRLTGEGMLAPGSQKIYLPVILEDAR